MTSKPFDPDKRIDGEDDARDLVSDIMHWMHRNEFGSAAEAVREAERRFTEETNGMED